MRPGLRLRVVFVIGLLDGTLLGWLLRELLVAALLLELAGGEVLVVDEERFAVAGAGAGARVDSLARAFTAASSELVCLTLELLFGSFCRAAIWAAKRRACAEASASPGAGGVTNSFRSTAGAAVGLRPSFRPGTM